jgi:4'-phosphopantetheinyl transferase
MIAVVSADASKLWLPAPDQLRLEPSDVHVWRADVGSLADRWARYVPILNAEEMARAARFVRDVDRSRFIVTRALLRVILGRYLGKSADGIDFRYSARGKPSLADPSFELTFNISHSGNLALFAIASARALGVDVEQIRPNLDFLTIVDRFFSEYEVRQLHARPVADQREAFFRGWVRKEAYIKARGEGLGIPLHSFDVTVFPDAPALLRAADDQTRPARWTFRELAPGSGYAGMVVAEGPIERMVLYSIGTDPGGADAPPGSVPIES